MGKYSQSDTRQKYHRLVAEWEANGRKLSVQQDQLTIVELVNRFWQRARTYYPENEAQNVRRRAQQESLGIGNEGTEIGHRAQAKKDNRWQQVPEGQAVVEDDPEDARLLELSGPGDEIGETGEGQVGDNDPQPNGQQLVRFHVAADRRIDERQADAQHNAVAPVDVVEAGGAQEFQEF